MCKFKSIKIALFAALLVLWNRQLAVSADGPFFKENEPIRLSPVHRLESQPAQVMNRVPQMRQFKAQDALSTSRKPKSLDDQFVPIPPDNSNRQDYSFSQLNGDGKILDLANRQRSISQSLFINSKPPRRPANDAEIDERSLPASSRQTGANQADCRPKSLGKKATSFLSTLRSGTIAVFTAIPLIASIITDFAAKRRRRADVESLSLRANSTAQRQPSIASTGSGFQGRVDTVMSWIERSVEHLPNIPRLHPQECVKRSICEAHNEPQKYGAIGFMLRLLFPAKRATNVSITDRMDNMEYKVSNKYRHAAGFGLNKRLENINGTSSQACKEMYQDCLVSLLDVAKNLMNNFLQ